MTYYDESLRRTRAMLNRELYLGRGQHTSHHYYLNPTEFLATHTHLIGASNFGKSFYLEHLLRAYTEVRIPASLIDPHGDQAEHYYQFLRRIPRLTRQHKIIHFKPGSAAGDAGFNPFRWNLQPGVIAGLMLEAFMKAWGQQSFNETPLLERVLHNMFHVFAVNRLRSPSATSFCLRATDHSGTPSSVPSRMSACGPTGGRSRTCRSSRRRRALKVPGIGSSASSWSRP